MENLGIPMNHISQLMGHEDSNMVLTNQHRKIIFDTKFTNGLRPDQHGGQQDRIKERTFVTNSCIYEEYRSV